MHHRCLRKNINYKMAPKILSILNQCLLMSQMSGHGVNSHFHSPPAMPAMVDRGQCDSRFPFHCQRMVILNFSFHLTSLYFFQLDFILTRSANTINELGWCMSSEVPFHPSLQPNLSVPMLYDWNVIHFCRGKSEPADFEPVVVLSHQNCLGSIS